MYNLAITHRNIMAIPHVVFEIHFAILPFDVYGRYLGFQDGRQLYKTNKAAVSHSLLPIFHDVHLPRQS